MYTEKAFYTSTMKTHPASNLKCPPELNGANQGKYVCFNTLKAFKQCDGQRTGWGALCRFDPDTHDIIGTYVGGLQENNAEGHGQLHIQAEKFSYIGGWRENVAAGWGKWCDSWTEEWPDGAVRIPELSTHHDWSLMYEGGFKDGYFDGYGELKWKTGANYKGSWKEGRRYGCGIYTSGGDDRYYWESELDDHCHSEDKRYKAEHRQRLEAEKEFHDELNKEKQAHDIEHAALEKEKEQYNVVNTEKKVAEAKLRQIEYGNFSLILLPLLAFAIGLYIHKML